LAIDKGSVVRSLLRGCTAACYFGDDLGDLPAFAALAEATAEDGTATVAVAVADDESPPEVLEAADVVLRGPGQALAALEWLARAGPEG
jgi:trehalose 6-phosphate phosphatase